MRTIPRVVEGDDVVHGQLFFSKADREFMQARWDWAVRAEYRRVKLRGFFWGLAVGAVAWVLARVSW